MIQKLFFSSRIAEVAEFDAFEAEVDAELGCSDDPGHPCWSAGPTPPQCTDAAALSSGSKVCLKPADISRGLRRFYSLPVLPV
jgi:hypothetical protein